MFTPHALTILCSIMEVIILWPFYRYLWANASSLHVYGNQCICKFETQHNTTQHNTTQSMHVKTGCCNRALRKNYLNVFFCSTWLDNCCGLTVFKHSLNLDSLPRQISVCILFANKLSLKAKLNLLMNPCSQFCQLFMSSFCANILVPKNYKAKL